MIIYWITVDEVDKLKSADQEKHDLLRDFVSDIDKNVPPLLAEWRKMGEEAGIDWNEIKVDTVYVTSWGDSNSQQLGAPEHVGYIVAQSNGKQFEIRFNKALERFIGEGWRMINLTEILQVEK